MRPQMEMAPQLGRIVSKAIETCNGMYVYLPLLSSTFLSGSNSTVLRIRLKMFDRMTRHRYRDLSYRNSGMY